MIQETAFLAATVLLFASPRLFRLAAQIKREGTKRKYARLSAPIFEFSGDELDRGVQARAADHRAWLAVVEHPFLGPRDVHAVVFCEGENWGETWAMFLARCAKAKTEAMRAFQKRMKGVSPEHYHRIVLGQSGAFDASAIG